MKNLILIALVTLTGLSVMAKPQSYIIAECTSSNYNAKTVVELVFDGTIGKLGVPAIIEQQDLVIQPYMRDDEESPWVKAEELAMYLVPRDEDTLVSQFFKAKPINIPLAIATTTKGWNLDYAEGSISMNIAETTMIMSATSREGKPGFSISTVIMDKMNQMMIRNSLSCKQFKPDGTEL